MFKLVVVAGKLRGKEFTIQQGESVLGKDSMCDLHLDIPGVSKKHMKLTVTGDVAYLEDLGSSNGTFLNGKIIKKATIRSGDKIALPDAILQVVQVLEKKVIVKKKVEKAPEVKEEVQEGYLPSEEMPAALPAKILYLFKYKVMPVVHGINEEYEWRILFGIILSIFLVFTVIFTIFPVLDDSKKLLLSETAKRGAHYADEIARINRIALEQKKLDRVDTNFMKSIQDVKSYELFDLQGRIVRPVEKLNEYISDSFSIKAREWSLSNKSSTAQVHMERLDDGEIGIAQKIMAYNPRVGVEEAVGVIAIRFAPVSLQLEIQKNSTAFLESLVTSAIVGIFFFGVIYYLTIRPIEEMRYQIEEALRGKRKNVENKLLMTELGPLRNTINSLLQRIRELSNEGGDSAEATEEDGPYVTRLAEFMKGAGIPVMILNSEKNVARLNTAGEDLTGIRESSSAGESLLNVAKEKGFAATVIELCDNSANNGGVNQVGSYELQGKNYTVNVTALIGKDNFAKAFYLTFVLDN